MASVGLSFVSPLGSNAVDGGPAAAMVDSVVLAAVEARLRTEFQVALAAEQERRVKAEFAVQELSGQVRELMEKMGCDTVAETRYDPQLVPQMYHMMPSPDESESATYQPMPINSRASCHASLMGPGDTYNDLADAQKDGMEFDYKDVPSDMWGVAIMTLTKDLADIMTGGEGFGAHLTRFVYAMAMVALNMSLQVAILYWVNMYVVGESVWTLQGEYAQYHHDLFDIKGNFLSDKWKDWDGPRDSLCGAVLTKSVFLSVILFLWSGRMMGELKTIKRLWDDISALPSAPAGATIKETILERNDQSEILALGGCVRFAIYASVILPKLLICLLLWFIGLRWLTATTSFADLILNALALEFVIGIDEQVLEFFLPKCCTENLETTKFTYPKRHEEPDNVKMRAMQRDYFRNIFYLVLVVAITVVYLKFVQQVIPYYPFDVGEHCGRWFEERFDARCKPFEKNCFPFGDVKAPHQYGELPAQ